MRSLADIRLDNIAIASVRRFTRPTLPDWCGEHRFVLANPDDERDDFYCWCGRMCVRDTEKRPRSRRWRPEGAPMMRQVKMAL